MPRDLLTPLALTVSGDLAEVQQGQLRDRQQRITAVLNTPAETVTADGHTIAGTLDDAPLFGRTVPVLGMNGVDTQQVEADIARAEPDLAFRVVQLDPTRDGGGSQDNFRVDVPEDLQET